MLKIFLTLLISLQFCIGKSQSPDPDGDGIRDEDDACPKMAGIADHQGCPGIKKEGIDANIKRQEDQFVSYINTFDFSQLAGLIVQKIDNHYFNSESLLSNDLVIVSIKTTVFSNDIGSAKPTLPEDGETLRSKLENNLWNEKNFEYFLKENSGKKVLAAHSYGDGNNIRIINFDHHLFPATTFLKGVAVVQEELLDRDHEKLYYYSGRQISNEEIAVSNDIVHRYAGLTIYILQIKNRKVKVGYYYNFRTWKFKNFQFTKNRWKEISDAEYDSF